MPRLFGHAPQARQAYLHGLRRGASFALPLIPFAIACGVAATHAGLDGAMAVGVAASVFAGSAQAAFSQHIAEGAPLWVAVLSGLVLNLRMAIYSADLADSMGSAPARTRALGAFFLVDQTPVLMGPWRRSGQLAGPELADCWAAHWGASTALWGSWVSFNALGALLGARIPDGWELEFAVPLAFVVMIAPGLRQRPVLTASVVGALLGLALQTLPMRLGLLLAGAAGALVAVLAERRAARPAPNGPLRPPGP